MKKLISLFRQLTLFEWCLWLCSLFAISLSFVISGILHVFTLNNLLNMLGSLIGVTSLIFIAKGRVFGLYLMVIFCLFYGYVSLTFKYYGELATYIFMALPTTITSIVSWTKNPYEKGNGEVKISPLNKTKIIAISVLTAIITVLFYLILKYFNTANLIISTLSIATSLIAASLIVVRSPYYALGYALNDLVLISLWIFASVSDLSYLPMVICFITFSVNDTYGYVSWKTRAKLQNK